MRYISVFSGIEAASVAFQPLGMEPVAFAEVDAHASAVFLVEVWDSETPLCDHLEWRNAYELEVVF